MTNKRKPGGLDLDDFAPAVAPKRTPLDASQVRDVQFAAHETGFTSRSRTHPKVDGRSLRRTDRHKQLNIKVTEETHARFFHFVQSQPDFSGGQALEMLLDTYDEKTSD